MNERAKPIPGIGALMTELGEFPINRGLLPDEEQIWEAVAIVRAECILAEAAGNANTSRRLRRSLEALAGREVD